MTTKKPLADVIQDLELSVELNWSKLRFRLSEDGGVVGAKDFCREDAEQLTGWLVKCYGLPKEKYRIDATLAEEEVEPTSAMCCGGPMVKRCDPPKIWKLVCVNCGYEEVIKDDG